MFDGFKKTTVIHGADLLEFQLRLALNRKELFIEMLTRDITLVEAILDLIDNSIHNVIRLTRLDVMRAALGGHQTGKLRSKTIFIEFSDKSFEIRDTCG